VIVLIIFNSFKLYEKRKTLNRLDEAFSLVKAIILGTAIIIGICYMIGWFKFSRSILILMMFFSIIMIITWRLIIRSIELMLIRRGVGAGRILLYGAGKAGKMIADEIRLHTSRGDAIVGFIDDDRTKLGEIVVNGLKVLGTRQDIPEIVQKNEVNEIIISMPSASNKRLLEISLFLKKHDIPFKIMPDVFDLITSKVNTIQIGSITLFELKESPLTPGKRLLKRVFDLIIATLLLVLSTPLWLPIIIAIKVTSKGPIFFIQERVKENGKIFQMYKFRTMVENAEKMRKDLEKYNLSDGPIFIMKNDPRITNIGELLRKTSLDEIPQLINVIKGDMTLVGPRPPIPSELEEYKQWHFKRITVPQGMTGLWQVSGRSDLSFNEMVKLDIYYIENWSLWLDLKIFLRTIPSVLFMKGAY
jgi:exopolysaccharide biosynthesis polyprenyl glycosylphosphotransferase